MKGLRLVQRRQLTAHIICALSGSACHSKPQRLLVNPFPAQSSAEIQPIRLVNVSFAKQVKSRRNKFTIRVLTHSEPPGYRCKKPRASKLEPFLPIIHKILKSDQQVHRNLPFSLLNVAYATEPNSSIQTAWQCGWDSPNRCRRVDRLQLAIFRLPSLQLVACLRSGAR